MLCASSAQLAEGPLWLEDWDAFAWVDIHAGLVTVTALDGSTIQTTQLAESVGSVCVAEDGTLVAATPSGLCRLSTGERLAALPGANPRLRMNDGKVDPLGRFIGGTMSIGNPVPGAGSLWSFEQARATKILGSVTISNGLCWSSDGTKLYYVDTPTQRIDSFDYDVAVGTLRARGTVVLIDEADGAPDGLTIDSAGGIWVALWGGGQVRRYLNGVLDAIVYVPTPFVTSVAFGGPALDTLIITTAAEPFGAQPPIGAGNIFRFNPGISGYLPNRYRLPDE